MYSMPMGNISGIVHLVAKRPYILAVIAVVAVVMNVPAPTPLPPAPAIPSSAPMLAYAPPMPTEPCQVEVPEPGAKPRQIGTCWFHYSAPPNPILGARVDNVCKRKLDDTILYLKAHQDTIVLEGNSLTGHGSIAMNRANNVRAYLIRNGIDPQRIIVKRGLKHSRVVDLIVGAGN